LDDVNSLYGVRPAARFAPAAPLRACAIMKTVRRAIASSLFSLLLTATLFWGGCVACPQFFMFPGVKKDCCKANKCEKSKAPKTTSKECNRMPLESHDSAQADIDLTAAAISAVDTVRATLERNPGALVPTPVEHSPPDTLALLGSLLI